jgi:hypothetical protein
MKILRILASLALGIFLIAAMKYQFTYSGAQIKAFYDWLNTVTATISTTEALLLDGHTALQEEPAEGGFVAGDKSKLDGIESNATADQTGAEIKTAYENEADTNAYTDSEKTAVGNLNTASTRAAEDTLTDGSNLPDGAAVKAYGDTYWGMTTSSDPDQSAGTLGQDADGANVTNDQTIRATDGSGNQWPVGRKLVNITFPFTTAGAITGWQPWTNETGMTFNLTRIFCRSDTDDLGIDIDEFTSIINATVLNVVVDVTVDADGTGIYYKTTTSGSMTDTQIEAQHGLSFDIDAAAEGFITFEGWFDANVD